MEADGFFLTREGGLAGKRVGCVVDFCRGNFFCLFLVRKAEIKIEILCSFSLFFCSTFKKLFHVFQLLL